MNDLIKLLQQGPDTPPLNRRRFFSTGALALASTLMVGRTASRAQACKRIEIPEITEERCLELMKLYSTMGSEPSLPVVLGVLIVAPGVLSKLSSSEARRLRLSFFTLHRVRRILRYAATPEADPRVQQALQRELDKRTSRFSALTYYWVAFSGCLKSRILSCFDEADLPLDRSTLTAFERVRLEDLLRLPLRTME